MERAARGGCFEHNTRITRHKSAEHTRFHLMKMPFFFYSALSWPRLNDARLFLIYPVLHL